MSGPSTREPTSQPFAPLDGTLAASLERAVVDAFNAKERQDLESLLERLAAPK